MMRRSIIALGAIGTALAAIATANSTGVALANSFAEAYSEWGALYSHRDPNALDLREVRAWKQVKERFSALRKHIDLEYEA